MLQIAVFASGRGSNFIALYNFLQKENVEAKISILISNNSNSGAIGFANGNNIPSYYLSEKNFQSKEDYQNGMRNVLSENKINFIVLAGYMKLIAPKIVKEFENRIINIHPALLPKFGGAGMFGERVHEAVIVASEKESGATVHFVNEEYDRGLIILQDKVLISSDETKESLAKKVLNIEHKILPEVVKLFAENKILIKNNKVEILK